MVTRRLTLAEIANLPAVTDLVTAARALGIGRTRAYELARDGSFPCRVIRAGKTWMVPTADLLHLLGLPLPGSQPDGRGPSGVPQAGGAGSGTGYRPRG
jgi:Helix-turn-helix domain